MRRIILSVCLLVALLAAVLPAFAQPRTPWPASDGDFGATRRSSEVGPDTPGIAWATPASDIEVLGGVFHGVTGITDNNGYDMILDGQGHLIAGGNIEDEDGSTELNVLAALNTADGSVAWVTDTTDVDIASSCGSVVDGTGGLWTMAERDSDSYVLPVELDPADGSVIARPLDGEDAADLPELTEGNGCAFPPTLTPDDVIVYQTRAVGQEIVGVDLTDGTLAWRVDLDAGGLGGLASWALPTPDGRLVLVGTDDDGSDEQVTVVALDATDGTVVDSAQVTGSGFYTVNQENPAMMLPDGSVVFGTDAGSLAGRLMRLAPDLSVMWDTPTVTSEAAEGDIRPLGSLALGGADGDLVVGWSISTPDDVYAVSVADGSLAWSADPVGFDAIPAISVGADGNAYVATFGTGEDARLQVLGPDGTPGDTLEGAALDESTIGGLNLTAMGPVSQDMAFAAAGGFEQTIFLGIDDSGAGLVPGVSRPGGTSDDPRQIAIDLCQFLNPAPDSVSAVVLAQDQIFADALTGSPLAGDDGCVLFTGRTPESLDSRTAAEIDRGLPDGGTVYVLGGESAIDASVVDTLSGAGYDVRRLAGTGRIQTAVEIAREVKRLNPDNTAAMLAFEGNWPDAVAGGAYGAETGTPILLTRTDSVPTETSDTLAGLGVDEVTILGSTGVISQAVEDSLPQPTVDRAGGANRMATAVEITQRLWLADTDAPGDTFLVVNLEAPNAWTIALAAAPLSASENAPQLGVGNGTYPNETRAFLESQGFTELPSIGLVGGLAFIGEDVEAAIGGSL